MAVLHRFNCTSLKLHCLIRYSWIEIHKSHTVSQYLAQGHSKGSNLLTFFANQCLKWTPGDSSPEALVKLNSYVTLLHSHTLFELGHYSSHSVHIFRLSKRCVSKKYAFKIFEAMTVYFVLLRSENLDQPKHPPSRALSSNFWKRPLTKIGKKDRLNVKIGKN